MNNQPFLYCTYADDVRQESNGKQMLIGVYQGGLIVASPFPTHLNQIYVIANLFIANPSELQSVYFKVDYNGQELITFNDDESRGLVEGFKQSGVPKNGAFIQAVFQIQPLALPAEGHLNVKATINDELILTGNSLQVTHGNIFPSSLAH